MSIFKTANGSSYTLSLGGVPAGLEGKADLIIENANSAILYWGKYIKWEGVLDFAVKWDVENSLGLTPDDPGFLAYGGVSSVGRTFAQHESITGEDLNGDDFDLGLWVNRHNTDNLLNYGESIFLDPEASINPNTKIPSTDLGGDFLSIFLHEVLHGLGFWSRQQHAGFEDNPTSFDQYTIFQNGKWYFNGPFAVEYFGSPIPLADSGSRDHYSSELPVKYNLNREYGLYDRKWSISNLELAMLKDLGLNIVDHPTSTPAPEPTDVDTVDEIESIDDLTASDEITAFKLTEPIQIGDQETENLIVGTGKKDKITGSSEGEVLAGGAGKDVLKGRGGPDGFLFQDPDGFGNKEADKVKDFDSDEGDSVLLDQDVFDLGKKIKLKTLTGKKAAKNATDSKEDFIYDDKKGLLYYNENGKEDGWGDGGLFVKLKGAPELGASDFTVF